MTDGVHEEWPADGYEPDMLWAYDHAFKNSLGFETLDAFAIAQKRLGRSTNVLDLFGSATISEKSYLYDSLTGVRMYPLEPARIPKGYTSPRWAEITGNIFSPVTWKEITARRRHAAIKGFDLILIRPMGPLFKTTRAYVENGTDLQNRGYLALLERVLERSLAILSPDDGICLVQIPPAIEESVYFAKWLQQIQHQGYSTQFDQDLDSPMGNIGASTILKLVKHAE